MFPYEFRREIALLFFVFAFIASIADSFGAEDPARSLMRRGIASLEGGRYGECLKALDESLRESIERKDTPLQADCMLWRSRYYLEMRLFKNAQDDAEAALRHFESLGNAEGIFSSKLVIASSLYERERNIAANLITNELERLLPSVKSYSCRVDFYLRRGEVLLERENMDLARKNFDEALRLAQSEKDIRRKILAERDLALFYSANKELEKSAQTCVDAIEDAEGSGFPFLVGLVLETEGRIKREAALYSEALICYRGAVEIYEQCGNKGNEGKARLLIADLYWQLTDWDRSEHNINKAHMILKESGDYYGSLICIYKLLKLAFSKGRREAVSPLVEELHQTAEKSGDIFNRAWAHKKQGRVIYEGKNNLSASLAAYEEAEKLYGSIGERQGEVECLVYRGKILEEQGKTKDALALYEKALSLSKTETGLDEKGDRDYFAEFSPGGIYREEGEVYTAQGLYNEAMSSYEKALEYDAGEDRTFFRLLDRLGIFQVSMAGYDIERARKELSISFEEIPMLKKAPERAIAYHQVTQTILNSSHSFSGTFAYDRLLSMKESAASEIIRTICKDPRILMQILDGYRDWIAYGKEKKSPEDEGIAYFLMGFFYFAGGKNTEARDAYDRAIDIFKSHKLYPLEGIVQFLSGLLYSEEGKMQEAKQALEESLRIFEKGGLNVTIESIQCFLAVLCREMGDIDESLSYYKKALSSAERSGNPRLASAALVGLGYAYYSTENYEEARACYEKARAYQEKSDNKRENALTLVFLGKIAEASGDTGRALDYYQKAIEEFKSLGSIFDVRDTSLTIGEVLEKSGRDNEALDLYLASLKDICEVRERLISLRETGRLSEKSPTRTLFERTIRLLAKSGRCEEALKYFDMAGSHDLFGNVDLKSIIVKDEKVKGLIEQMEKLSKKMKMIQDDIEREGSGNRRGYLSDVLASTKQQFFSVTNEIREKNPDYGQFIALQGPELAQLQPAIPDDTLLLEYYPSTDGLFIFVVSKDSFSIRHSAVTRERLYELIGELRKGIQGPGEGDNDSFSKARALLYGYLIKPVRDDIEKKERLEIIPSGLLWYLPLEILGEEGGRCLIEEKPVGYLYSSNILKLLVSREKEISASEKLVAFGNPAGADLPSSYDEVRDVSDLFVSSLSFTGNEATKERFMKEAPQATLLHIATHSSLNREDINRSYIQFAGEKDRLSLGEIYGLALPRMSLVVLSSCESAIGSDNPGSEFASLASAFSVAGSPSVIASLWRVEDSSTARLFTEFYENLKNGCGKSDSLRRAKLALLNNASTAEPFRWAGFILLGDWR